MGLLYLLITAPRILFLNLNCINEPLEQLTVNIFVVPLLFLIIVKIITSVYTVLCTVVSLLFIYFFV